MVLRPSDVVFGTYRGHALYLAKGGSLKGMLAELYGKSTGCAKGKGGSMHLIGAEKCIMGIPAIVGITIPLAVGYAYGLKYKQSDSVVVSFFGDGAVEGHVLEESYTVPFGKVRVLSRGNDIILVGISQMVVEYLRASYY